MPLDQKIWDYEKLKFLTSFKLNNDALMVRYPQQPGNLLDVVKSEDTINPVGFGCDYIAAKTALGALFGVYFAQPTFLSISLYALGGAAIIGGWSLLVYAAAFKIKNPRI